MNPSAPHRPQEQANSRIALMLLALMVGFAVGALVVYRTTRTKPSEPIHETKIVLSESTKAVLHQLRTPVEVRFYALFGGEAASESLRELAINVNELLAEFERQSGGKLTVTHFDEWSAANTKAAAADGVVASNLEKGDPSYVGLTVIQDTRKETISQLAPEFAQAVEHDLARTISRLANPKSSSSSPPSPANKAQMEKAEAAVKQTIPNPAAISLEEGKRLLRESSLRGYQALVDEMNREVQQGEQLVNAATADADRQIATQKLLQVRTSYAEKLRAIALQSQVELEAWTKLKEQ
jgi:hypothetical protein